MCTRSFLFHVNLPKCFWSFSLCHATYLINILCSPTIHNNTPYELLFKELPTFTHLNIFGCLTYANTITRHRDKLEPRATKCVFLGYHNGIKGYLLFDLHTRATIISRDCVFFENNFPYTTLISTHEQTNDNNHTTIPFIFNIPTSPHPSPQLT